MGMKLITKATGAALAKVFGLAAALWKKSKRRGTITANGVTLLFRGDKVFHITGLWWAVNGLTGKYYDMLASLGFIERASYSTAHTGGVYTPARHVAKIGFKFVTNPDGSLSGRNYVELEGNRTGRIEWVPDGTDIATVGGSLAVPRRAQTPGMTVVTSNRSFVDDSAILPPREGALLKVRGAASTGEVAWEYSIPVDTLSSTYIQLMPCDGAVGVIGASGTFTGSSRLPQEPFWHVTSTGVLSSFPQSSYSFGDSVYILRDMPATSLGPPRQPMPYFGRLTTETIGTIIVMPNPPCRIASADKAACRLHAYAKGTGPYDGAYSLQNGAGSTNYAATWDALNQQYNWTETSYRALPVNVKIHARFEAAYNGSAVSASSVLETLPVHWTPNYFTDVSGSTTFYSKIHMRAAPGFGMSGEPAGLLVRCQGVTKDIVITSIGTSSSPDFRVTATNVHNYRFWAVSPTGTVSDLGEKNFSSSLLIEHTNGPFHGFQYTPVYFEAVYAGRGPRGTEYLVFTDDGVIPVVAGSIGEPLPLLAPVRPAAECAGGYLLESGTKVAHYSFSNGAANPTGFSALEIYTGPNHAILVGVIEGAETVVTYSKFAILDLQTRTVTAIELAAPLFFVGIQSMYVAVITANTAAVVRRSGAYVTDLISVNLTTYTTNVKQYELTDVHVRTTPAESRRAKTGLSVSNRDSYLLP